MKIEAQNQTCIFLELKMHLTEAYLEPSRTSSMEMLCKNSEQLKTVDYFRKKAPSQMLDRVLNTPLS